MPYRKVYFITAYGQDTEIEVRPHDVDVFWEAVWGLWPQKEEHISLRLVSSTEEVRDGEKVQLNPLGVDWTVWVEHNLTEDITKRFADKYGCKPKDVRVHFQWRGEDVIQIAEARLDTDSGGVTETRINIGSTWEMLHEWVTSF